jgi:glycosyltransferase involved in cell wall biosynthesis
MLKIATVTEEGRFGGPQRWISAVSGKLKDFGFDQIVIFPTFDSDRFYEELNLQKIETRRIALHRPTKEKTHLIKFILLFLPEIVLLYKLFKKEGIDIVHCNNSWQFKGVIAGKLAGKKIVWHLHETSTPFFVNIVFKFLASYFCDTFITAGTRVKSYYINGPRFAQKQIVEIQAPVDTALFDPEKVVKDPVIGVYAGLKIVTVGNINPTKGVEYFTEMASILNQRYDNLNFFVVGPYLDSQRVYSDKIVGLMKTHNLKNLHFYGSSENIPSILKAADVYVCSSIAEASPISVWEAMSMGKAIVSTHVGDVAKFIKNGISGYIVPTKNALAMAEKVELLIENENLRKKMGGNARKIAAKNLDVDICTKKQAEFYREIMEKH